MPIRRRPVEAYDADGKLIGQWESTLQAATENDGKPGFSKQVIKNCASCQRRTECSFCKYFRNYHRTWKYEQKEIQKT